MRRHPSTPLVFASALLAGCVSTSGFDAGPRTLHYVSPLEALTTGQVVYRDCRTRAGQDAAVFKDWVLAHHRIAVRYWIVPTAGALPLHDVEVDGHDCVPPGPPLS